MNATAPNSTSIAAPRRGGFTLIEMIVVIVIISVLAGVTSIRMGRTLARRGRITVQRVQNVLDALAHRQVASQAPAALVYDAGVAELWVERLEPEAAVGEQRDRRPDRGQWVRDAIAPSVKFDNDIYLSAAVFDGRAQRGSFRIEVSPESVRPTIELDITFDDTTETVSLLPSEMRSMSLADEAQRVRLRPEDLNAQGAGDEKW